ncbi:MAG: hypothetical protein M3514_08115, partial [Actinomycetota bacterium]|nr:hypothetical protein [Actinomycetota bacterium]
MANNGLGSGLSNHDVETHRQPEGLDRSIRDPIRRCQKAFPDTLGYRSKMFSVYGRELQLQASGLRLL